LPVTVTAACIVPNWYCTVGPWYVLVVVWGVAVGAGVVAVGAAWEADNCDDAGVAVGLLAAGVEVAAGAAATEDWAAGSAEAEPLSLWMMISAPAASGIAVPAAASRAGMIRCAFTVDPSYRAKRSM
jgi:hypothetical protein